MLDLPHNSALAANSLAQTPLLLLFLLAWRWVCDAGGSDRRDVLQAPPRIQPEWPITPTPRAMCHWVLSRRHIATKLTHVVWRKLIPDEREVADGLLNMVCYRLLKQEKFPLAQKILSFALNLPHHSTHKRKLIFVINKAIAEKFSDNTDYQKTLSDVDWTACSADFQLAVAVLNERFEEAVTIMYRMGRTGLVHKPDYKDWPVFRNFRKTEDFKRAFRAIFSEEIELIEITQGDVIQLIDEEESKSLPESGKNDVIDSQ